MPRTTTNSRSTKKAHVQSFDVWNLNMDDLVMDAGGPPCATDVAYDYQDAYQRGLTPEQAAKEAAAMWNNAA